MLKPYSASSFCLPNKNRVGVAHGDGTNLEVVYKKNSRYIDKRYRKQGKGKFSQGKGGTKTCDDSSIGSCVRASVTEARVTVYCVRAYAKRMCM